MPRSTTALVAVDGTPLQTRQPGGVARYVTGLVGPLADELEVVVLVDGRAPLPALAGVPVVPLPFPPGLPRLAWLELAAGRWLRRHDAVFLGTFCASPIAAPRPAVTVFHDIAWETHPEDFPRAKRRVWSSYTRVSARRSAALVAVSAFTARQVAEAYGLAPGEVLVAPNAVNGVFRPGAGGALPSGVRAPFVVTLGGARRRHLDEAVGAWRRARAGHGDLQLVVVGDEAPPAEPGLLHVGRVDDRTLAALLAGAEALVYATTFEGFGLPAAEAMACGTPVVCAPVGALPEVLGDAGAWADAPTAPRLGSRLLRLLDDADDRTSLRAAARRRAAAAPTWHDTARLVAGACRDAWDGRRG